MAILLSKNACMARSISFSLSKSSCLSRLIGFCSSKNSSSIGFRPSLMVCPCRRSNCYCLPMTNYSTSTESRIPTMQVPWLMLAPESNVYRFYSLSEKDVKEVAMYHPPDADSRCFGQSCQGWMGYIRHKDCQVFVFNPLSRQEINLATVETIPSVECVIRNSQSGLVKSVISDLSCKPLAPQICYRGLIKNVVLSSSPMGDDCIAVVSYGGEDKLAFCRRSRTPNCWIPLHSPFIQYEQIVYHSGRKLFYTLSGGLTIQLEAWDLHSDPIKRFHIEEDQSQLLRQLPDWTPCDPKSKGIDLFDPDLAHTIDWDRMIHLAYDHQNQELFIVMRHVLRTRNVFYKFGVPHIVEPNIFTHKTLTFDVFKVDFVNDHLVNIQYLEESIGNRAFFVGKDKSFVLSTTEFPELRPGSIYFADGMYDWRYNFAGHDMGIYDYADNDFIGKIESISPAHSWFTPDVDATAISSRIIYPDPARC